MLGKKVLNNVYWHCSLTESQKSEVQQTIKRRGVSQFTTEP